jgi:glycosyltransferase involved in cell wall biosynthesis
MKPLVSIIITTKNEEKNIGHCLESIKRQTYPADRIEIIVVDNHSSDATKKTARKFTKKIYDLGPERSAQRNYGMLQKARGKYVMYLDADMILSSTVVEKAVERLKGGFVALYIPEVVVGNSYFSRVRRFERSFYDGTVIDCVRIIEKEAFKKVGGFDPDMTGPEDWDLDKKIRKQGKVAVLEKYCFKTIDNKLRSIDCQKDNWPDQLAMISSYGLICHNEGEFNLKKYLAKKAYYSRSFETYINKWGKNDPDIKKQFGLFYRYFGVFWSSRIFCRIARYPHLFVGMFFLRCLVGLIYLFRRKY